MSRPPWPGPVRRSIRYLRLFALDIVDVILRRRPPLVPPRREVWKIGGHDFIELGEHLSSIARDLGGLQPHERLLDIGSGVGRLAVGLTGYLTPGEYAGFDVDRPGIAWCRRTIEPRFPNFRFTRVDVRNRHYNPKGAIAPESFVFPYATESMDVVFASSLFTHLTPAVADHYLGETRRVLKQGGRLVASFFLINEHSRQYLDRTEPRFIIVDRLHAVQDPENVERAIAFDEQAVIEALDRHGMSAMEIRHGGWAYREGAMSFQDFVLARKE